MAMWLQPRRLRGLSPISDCRAWGADDASLTRPYPLETPTLHSPNGSIEAGSYPSLRHTAEFIAASPLMPHIPATHPECRSSVPLRRTMPEWRDPR